MRGESASSWMVRMNCMPVCGSAGPVNSISQRCPSDSFSECEWSIIQHVRAAWPVLLIVVSFGQQPDFVAAIVKPLIRTWRKILPANLGFTNRYECPAKMT